MFDFNRIVNKSKLTESNSFERRMSLLESQNKETLHIKSTVDSAIANLRSGKNSFVIYGEPQSGKTEMMIALSARLLDEGYKLIVILMNDSLALLNQNLTRFKKAGLSTVPVNYKELLDKSVEVKSRSRVVFSKKNASDLRKLNELLRKTKDAVIIDDEADYATPNSKINKNEISTINKLTGELISKGNYIGVTATPARLDLNNTHLNEPEYWIDFPAHSNYTGQNIFFPNNISSTSKFMLNLLPDENDNPKYLRNALFGFLVNSAYLNLTKKKDNYTMLIHTSGKKNDHQRDFDDVNSVIKVLTDENAKKRERYFKEIWEIAEKRYGVEADDVVGFILSQIESVYLVVMNSDHDFDTTIAEEPPSAFTIIVGGNTVSRGVTFNNLLSMYFTRDAKHKIQQDTYIQRARMFGSRGALLSYFELSIPRKLYADWRRAFIFHRLSLESRKNGNGIPVWHEGMRIRVAAASSIDTSRVTFDRGEMSFNKFKFDSDVIEIFQSDMPDFDKLEQLSLKLEDNALPKYLTDFIIAFSGKHEKALIVHTPRSVDDMDPKYTDKKDISRKRGLIAGKDLASKAKPDASHHLFIFTNKYGKARIVYKFNENISFIKGKM